MAVRRAVMGAPAANSRRRRDGTTLVVISVFLQVLEARNRNAESRDWNTAATDPVAAVK
jgi:hypothetical protein